MLLHRSADYVIFLSPILLFLTIWQKSRLSIADVVSDLKLKNNNSAEARNWGILFSNVLGDSWSHYDTTVNHYEWKRKCFWNMWYLDGDHQAVSTRQIDPEAAGNLQLLLVAFTTAGRGSGCLIQQKQAQWAKVKHRVNAAWYKSKRPIATIYMMVTVFNSQCFNLLFTSPACIWQFSIQSTVLGKIR